MYGAVRAERELNTFGKTSFSSGRLAKNSGTRSAKNDGLGV
jgi:hypothetical protein